MYELAIDVTSLITSCFKLGRRHCQQRGLYLLSFKLFRSDLEFVVNLGK